MFIFSIRCLRYTILGCDCENKICEKRKGKREERQEKKEKESIFKIGKQFNLRLMG